MPQTPGYALCPMCGMEFEKQDSVCAHGCPLGWACSHVRCPNCDFEFPEAPQTLTWLQRVFGRKAPPKLPATDRAMGLEQLQDGETAELLNLACMEPGRRNTLTVFGLTPGTRITLLQRRPSFVIRVGETELGLETDIARQILVRRLE